MCIRKHFSLWIEICLQRKDKIVDKYKGNVCEGRRRKSHDVRGL